jgi:hypothetical protein
LRIVLRLPFCRHGLSARSALFLARRFPAGSHSRAGRSNKLDAGQKLRRSQAVTVFTGENSPAKLALHTANSEPYQHRG